MSTFAFRVAVNFLDSRNFCKNSHHFKGETRMRKRHLEILGYHVVHVRKHCSQKLSHSYYMHQNTVKSFLVGLFLQIPHFEWNSMELSTQDAWKEYLKKKIFEKLSS